MSNVSLNLDQLNIRNKWSHFYILLDILYDSWGRILIPRGPVSAETKGFAVMECCRRLRGLEDRGWSPNMSCYKVLDYLPF